MSKTVTVHDQVEKKADEIAKEREITRKEAFRDVFREAGYDV